MSVTSFKEYPDCECGHPEPYHHVQGQQKADIPDGYCRVTGCSVKGKRCKGFREKEAKE